MPERVRSPLILALMLLANAPRDQLGEFDAEGWLADPLNLAFRIGPDLALFEHLGPNTYLGHCFFASRGKTARRNAQAMMAALPGARIIGEVPYWRRDVRLFMGTLGFASIGQAERPMGKVIVMERKRELNPVPRRDRTALSLA